MTPAGGMEHLVTVLAGVLVAEAGLRIGAGVVRWLRAGGAAGAIRTGAGFLVGWAVLGAWLFGFAAVGLGRASVLPTAAGLLVVAGSRSRRPAVSAMLGAVWSAGGVTGRIVFGAAAGHAGLRMLLPEFD